MARTGGIRWRPRVGKRYFGSIRKLPSGRVQARYTGPDGVTYTAPVTFDSRQYAEAFLARIHGDIQAGRWESPNRPPEVTVSPPTLADYTKTWLADRDLADSTRLLYDKTLKHILPPLGNTLLPDITPAMVREWHAKLKGSTGPTQRAHCYGLLRTILGTAVTDEIIPASPCRIRGAGNAKRVRQIRAATLPELEAIAVAMPDRYRLMVLLAAWCALRFGELAELRRDDIDLRNGVVHIRRGVVRTADGLLVKGPKSEAGKRDVTIPPHLMPAVKAHLAEHVDADRDGLVFPAAGGGHMSPATLYRHFYPARTAAGRPDLRFHDLRHTGAVLAAATGATLAELMARLGHSTVSAALRYQHAAAERDKVIAVALSELADGTVTPISRSRSRARPSARPAGA
jgi:integrase